MDFKIQAVILLLSYALLGSPASTEELTSIEGAVVAIQRGEKDTRLIDPPSFADLAEIYMMRVDHWSQPHKEKYVLVEYVHHDDLIGYDKFDKTAWRFEFEQPSAKDNDECHSWMARSKSSFIPTAFGRREKLPDPKTLSCFLVTKQPVPIRQGKETSRVDPKDGSMHVQIPVVATAKSRQ
ncbi:MAG TPA: hypothetical protein VMI32_19970 [Candidatus Solibacter sp.]|nr:hypothetical protein [Candidatus Solibacter sp.]